MIWLFNATFNKKNEKELDRSFHFRLRYIDDVISLNDSKLGDCADLSNWTWNKDDTTHTARSASYLDLHLVIDSDDRLKTKIYDKRDDFNYPFVTFHLYRKQHIQPAYGVYLSVDTIFQILWFVSVPLISWQW